jgi:hypothetical protein
MNLLITNVVTVRFRVFSGTDGRLHRGHICSSGAKGIIGGFSNNAAGNSDASASRR